MPSRENTVRKESTKKQTKRLPPISTDAALFTSTFFAFLLTASNPLAFQEVFSALTAQAQEKAAGSEVIPPMAFEAMKPFIEKNLALSCDTAAHLLASVLFLEKIYKRIDLKDPRDIVTIIYCAIRLAKDQKEFDKIKQVAVNDAGKHWLWPLVWELALMNESVKKRWGAEEAKSRLNLYDWKDECQKFANNYWSSRQAEFENIKARKAKMISSLRKTLGLPDIETPPNV